MQEIRRAFETCFLPNVPHLRRITFLSLRLPKGWNGFTDENYAFNAPVFQWYIESLGAGVPTTIRYVRYRFLVNEGECPKTTVYYHRLEPKRSSWWMLLSGRDGEEMFEKEMTPQVVPLAG